MSETSFELSIPIEKIDTELVGIEVGIIEMIQVHREKHKISMRQLSALTGLSVGKLNYHLQGGGGSSLGNLLLIAQKIGFAGAITINLTPHTDKREK